LVSGSTDTTIKLWSIGSYNKSTTLLGHTEGITTITFSPKGDYFASGSADSKVMLWSFKQRKEVVEFLENVF
jgi:WD40 repeat protein